MRAVARGGRELRFERGGVGGAGFFRGRGGRERVRVVGEQEAQVEGVGCWLVDGDVELGFGRRGHCGGVCGRMRPRYEYFVTSENS